MQSERLWADGCGRKTSSCYSPNFSCSNLFLRENESCIMFLKSSLYYEHILYQLVLHTQAVSCLWRFLCSSSRLCALSFTRKFRAEVLSQQHARSTKGEHAVTWFLKPHFSDELSFALFFSVHSVLIFGWALVPGLSTLESKFALMRLIIWALFKLVSTLEVSSPAKNTGSI